MPSSILLEDLVSECVALCHKACDIIRQVQKEKRKTRQEALQAQLKDASDPTSYLTRADQLAQDAIVSGLRRRFGAELPIVAEEDQAVASRQPQARMHTPTKTKSSLELSIPEHLRELDVSETCVFVDPLDGTREFVEERLSAVQSLLGVSYRGRAVAGVVGVVFFEGEYQSKVLYSVVGSGKVVGLDELLASQQHQQQQPNRPSPTLVLSADHEKNRTLALAAARDCILQCSDDVGVLTAGACGNKILQLLLGKADVALFNLKSSRWDTCATEALLTAVGGRTSTLLGWPIEHNVTKTGLYANRLGVLATGPHLPQGCSHDVLTSQIQRQRAVLELLAPALLVESLSDDEDQAVDIARNLQGEPWSIEELSKALGASPGEIMGYTVSESEAVRYKQSHACRLRLVLSDSSCCIPKSIFCKRIVLRELPYAMHKMRTAPFKLPRDLAANLNEAKFLSSPLAKEFNGRDEIVTAYQLEQRTFDQSPIDSRFCLLLKDFGEHEGWHQHAHLPQAELRAALCCLARLHAFLWLGPREAGGQQEVWRRSSCGKLLPTGNWTKCRLHMYKRLVQHGRVCCTESGQKRTQPDARDLCLVAALQRKAWS